MSVYNTHVHTHNSHDSKSELKDIYKEAITAGLIGFSVTDHCDCEYAAVPGLTQQMLNSFDEVIAFRDLYAGPIGITAGAEIGDALFSPDYASFIIRQRPWDVINGSVHAVRIKDNDIPFSLIDFSKLPDDYIHLYLSQYFSDVLEMVRTQDFDVLCHLTVPLRYIVGKYGRKIETEHYYPIIKKILSETIRREKILEINTSGYSPEAPFFMPDEMITDIYQSLGGKYFCIGSDAHTPQKIANGMEAARIILAEKGVRELWYFEKRNPVRYPIIEKKHP